MVEKIMTEEYGISEMEDRELSSGETKELEREQLDFNSIFEEYEDEEDADLKIWNLYLEDNQIDGNQAKLFFDQVAKLKYVPTYKYVIRYLLLRYRISLGKTNMQEMWKYIEENTPDIDMSLGKKKKAALLAKLQREEEEEASLFVKEDYDVLMSVVIQNMKEEFLQNGYAKKSVRAKYFLDLIMQIDEVKLRELALGLNWDYKYFTLFRKKVLRKKEINIYNKKDILLAFVLKYATECGYNSYFEAYELLENLYPKQEQEKDKEKESNLLETRVLTNWFKQYLEEDGKLKEEYKDKLFTTFDSEIGRELSKLESITKKERKGKRRAEKIFAKEWEDVFENTKKYVKDVGWKEELQEDKEVLIPKNDKKDGKKDDISWTNQNVYEFLYGRNVLKREHNHIEDIKEKNMKILGREGTDYFLDSKIFIQTRVRDNIQQAFPTDEETQRNLLMTTIFLNYVTELDGLSDDYGERITDFEVIVYKKMKQCGFMPLYSGYAYDAFLKLLLSCDSPLELFRYIWRQKTKSLN